MTIFHLFSAIKTYIKLISIKKKVTKTEIARNYKLPLLKGALRIEFSDDLGPWMTTWSKTGLSTTSVAMLIPIIVRAFKANAGTVDLKNELSSSS